MTRNENHDASSNNRFETRDNDGTSHWSNLNQDVLFLVLIQLGVFDYFAFSRVCKSWRSFALSTRFKFMASRSPMFKSTVPYSGDSTYIGSTYGYLILFSKTADFWLLNPITRHELYCPCSPFKSMIHPDVRGIVAFSRSIRHWVFVVRAGRNPNNIFFSIAGRGTWKRVSSTCPIVDLDAFNREPKLALLETKNFPIFARNRQLVSSCKNLYLREYLSEDSYKFHKLDLDKMSWVSCEKTKEECAFTLKHSADAKNDKGKLFSTTNMGHVPMIE